MGRYSIAKLIKMTWFKLTKKNVSYLALLVLVVVFLVPTLVFGADKNGASEADWLEQILWTFVVGVFGTLVWLAGQLLNVAVETYVVGFADQFVSTGLGFAVENLWKTVRDIFNLTFIFGLVYIGFKMILNTEDANAKRMLVHIILAALLVNFSLFFTKVVIDFSNVAAAQIAQGFYVQANNVGEKYNVSDQFAQLMGITSLFKDDQKSAQSLATGKALGFTYIFFTMIMFIILAFVFFAGAMLLMIRFATLNLYMILSPIMFLGMVFPALKSYSEKYWSSFLSRAFFAPAYLLMLYFAFIVMQEYSGIINSKGSFRELFSGEAGTDSSVFATTIPFFALICIFLIAAVVVAQKMGGHFSGFIISTTKNTTGKIALGLPALALQRTVGAGANRVGNKIMSNEKWRESRLGRHGIAMSRKVADSSFDARRASILGSPTLGKATGMGEGKAGGYTTMLKEKEKADKAFAESLEVKTKDTDGKLLPEIENKINNSQNVKDAKEKFDKLETEVKDVEKSVDDKEKEIKVLERKLAQENDADKKETIRKELETGNNDLNKLKSDYKNKVDEKNKANTNHENSMLLEEARIKYGAVLAFRDRRKDDAELFSEPAIKKLSGIASAAATAGALAAVGMTGGALIAPAAIMGLLGHEVVRTVGERNQKGAQAITNVYGSTGIAKMKNDKQKRDLRILAEMQKEVGGTENSTPEAPKT